MSIKPHTTPIQIASGVMDIRLGTIAARSAVVEQMIALKCCGIGESRKQNNDNEHSQPNRNYQLHRCRYSLCDKESVAGCRNQHWRSPA